MENQFILTESFINKYGGDYLDIEDVLKDLCKKFGKELGWECTNSYSTSNFEFKSGTWSSRVTITVKISKTGIYIKCITNGKPIEHKNKENCENFLSLIVPRIEQYLISKESERLVKEKHEELILNSKVETIENEIDTTVTSNEILQQIEKLSNLKDSGILTQEEFDEQKTKLLSKL